MSHRVIACIVMDPVSVLQVQVAVVNRRDWSKASTSSALFRGGGGRSGSSSIPSRVPIHNRGDITGVRRVARNCIQSARVVDQRVCHSATSKKIKTFELTMMCDSLQKVRFIFTPGRTQISVGADALTSTVASHIHNLRRRSAEIPMIIIISVAEGHGAFRRHEAYDSRRVRRSLHRHFPRARYCQGQMSAVSAHGVCKVDGGMALTAKDRDAERF